MIAQLGMYDMPATRNAHDRYWSLIRGHLGYGPERLSRDTDFWAAWQSPELLLAQTCGLPFRARLHEVVTLVGTPAFDLPGCPPGYYNSVLVARTDDRRDPPDLLSEGLAYNEALSQSGWAAPMAYFKALGLTPGRLLPTGGHAASAAAVAEGRAALAGLDAVTWELLRRHSPVAASLREVARTEPTPGLPYITAAGRDPEPIARAVSAAIGALAPADRDTLMIRGFERIPESAYLALPLPPAPD